MTVPRRIAALPGYIASGNNVAFLDAAPGHKFLGYFRNFQDNDGRAFDPYKGKARLVAPLPSPGPANRAEQAQLKNEFDGVLNEVCKLPAASLAQVAALRARQQALINHYGSSGYRIATTSTAPFATGLGNEHPIENGFAFLTPYGLPYLAGSGVKGILRRAMQVLRDDGEDGFTDAAIDVLFGPEKIDKPEDARRGALDFWDVFPNPAGGKMVVEIMTPHFSKYYQGEETPHDSGAPIPVSFLAVPAKSQFDFHVVCQPSRLPESLKDQWQVLVVRAFQYAFEWVGFGAKTSVGYGAMRPAANSPAAANSSGAAAASRTAELDATVGHETEIWPSARVKFNRTNGTLTAESNGAQAHAIAPQGETILNALPSAIQTKIRRNEFVKAKVLVAGSILIKFEL